jgi:uncharacterized membrane protein
MIEALRSMLADPGVPNLHVVIVHFPIAFITLAPVLDLACLISRRRVWLDRAAAALYLMGTLAAGAAYLSGQRAASELASITPAAESVLADHEAQAVVALTALAVASLVRLMVTWLARDDRRITIGIFRLLALPVAVIALVMLALTADLGGHLVYRHGVGVSVTADTPDRQ